MRVIGVLILVGAAGCGGNAVADRDDGPTDLEFIFGDSMIEGPSYSKLVRRIRRQVNDSTRAELIEYGSSVGGRDLVAVRIMDESPASTITPRQAMLVTGATHGHEYLNIADRLVTEILAQENDGKGMARFLDGGGVLYLVPIFNPDGYEQRNRRNDNDVDLNRDFDQIQTGKEGFTEPETENWRGFLTKDLEDHDAQLILSVDYHCCSLLDGGALIYPWSYSEDAMLPSDDEARFVRIGESVRQLISESAQVGHTFDVFPGRLPEGSSKDYYYTTWGTLAMTFEGRKRVEQEAFRDHMDWWNWLANEVIEGL